MAIYQTDYARGVRNMPVAQGAELLAVRMAFSLVAALVATDVIEFGFLPADHVPVDYLIDTDDLDAGATITTDFGILTAAGTAVSAVAADGGAKWLTASTALQAATNVRPSSSAHTRVQPSSTTNRKVGMVIIAGPSTASTGIIGVTLMYRAAKWGQ